MPSLNPDPEVPPTVPEANQPGHRPDVDQDKPTGPPPRPTASIPRTTHFEFEFEPSMRLPALAVGVVPSRAEVEVGERDLTVRFGMWSLTTPLTNVADATVAVCRYAASQPVAQVLVSDAGEGSASVTVRIFRLGPMPTRVRESGAYGIGSRTGLDLEMSHSAADGWVVADRTHLNTAVVGEVGTGAPPRR